VVEAAISSNELEMRLFQPIEEEDLQCILDDFKNLPNRETHTIRVQLRGPKEMLGQEDTFLCMYLMNCFLALNLSAPGCAEMHARFQGSNGRLNEVELDCLNWLSAWNKVWPVVRSMPLEKTMKWLTHIHFGKTQLAKTAIDKLLIALLRVSESKDCGPAEILWLSQALEAVVDSPLERITSTLQKRLLALLGTPHLLKETRKKILGFYNLRSRIVHGDFPFIHPAGNKIDDPGEDPVCVEIYQAIEFAMDTLVAIAQLFVSQEWCAVSFVENIRGTEYENLTTHSPEALIL
jgi:hypothetical protein